MRVGEIIENNRLMMRDAIAEATQGVEPLMHVLAVHVAAIAGESAKEAFLPEGLSVALRNKGNPKTKAQFSDDCPIGCASKRDLFDR